MQQQERINDFENALRIAFDAFAVRLHCAAPGIVSSFDATRGTAVISLAIQSVVRSKDGSQSLQTIRPLVDVPVVFMGGGGMVATFPIAQGDEALVIFADRCIDSWFQSGGVQKPAEPRVHHISDGIAIVGPRSLAKMIPNVSTTTAQFRSLSGDTYFEVAAGGKANVVAPSGLKITGPVTIDGDVSITGTVAATEEGTFNNIPVSSHLHGGVAAGGGNTGTPIP